MKSGKTKNQFTTLTFFLEEDNNVSYANLKGERFGAPLTSTIASWLMQEKLEDRQVAALTRYLRRLDKVLDENFESPDAYTSRHKRRFKVTKPLKDYLHHYQTQLWH